MLRRRINTEYLNITKSLWILNRILDYLFPPIVFWFSLSTFNPLTRIAQQVITPSRLSRFLSIVMPRTSIPVTSGTVYWFRSFTRLHVGIETFFALMIAKSVMAIPVLMSAYGEVALYLWTLLILPVKHGDGQSELSFDVGIKVHRRLRIMTKLQEDIAQDFITSCLHHFYCVIGCTLGLYVTLTQFVNSVEISFLVIAIGFVGILTLGLTESATFSFIALGAKASKEFIARNKQMNLRDKYQRKVIASLLPNSINLEVLSSLDTLRNGIDMKYFLNFLDRVADLTITILLQE